MKQHTQYSLMQPTLGQSLSGKIYRVPACVGTEEAAGYFGWPAYYIPILVRAGHMKPLGKPAQNSRKWFSTEELEQLCRERDWLDRAVRIVEKHVHDRNAEQRGRLPESKAAS